MAHDADRADAAIDRLVAAYRSAGLGRVKAPRSASESISEVVRAVAPMRPPVALLRLWERVDLPSLATMPWPGLTSPEFALSGWREHMVETPGTVPAALFPIAYASWTFTFVELEQQDHPGGALVEWGYGGSDFTIVFPDLVALLDLWATWIELGEFEHRHGTCLFDPREAWTDALRVRLAAALPLPHHGHTTRYAEDVRQWPEHWQTSSGLGPASRALRGATTTIAALTAAAASASASGTIRARVVAMAGNGAGHRVRVEDASGVLDLWCPKAVTAYGPIISEVFEFDVVVRRAPGPTPDWDDEQREVAWHARQGDTDAANEASRRLYDKAFGSTAAAEATAIRRL